MRSIHNRLRLAGWAVLAVLTVFGFISLRDSYKAPAPSALRLAPEQAVRASAVAVTEEAPAETPTQAAPVAPQAEAPPGVSVIPQFVSVTLIRNGQEEVCATGAGTVGELLRERGITLEEGETLSCPRTAPVEKGMAPVVITEVSAGEPAPPEELREIPVEAPAQEEEAPVETSEPEQEFTEYVPDGETVIQEAQPPTEEETPDAEAPPEDIPEDTESAEETSPALFSSPAPF